MELIGNLTSDSGLLFSDIMSEEILEAPLSYNIPNIRLGSYFYSSSYSFSWHNYCRDRKWSGAEDTICASFFKSCFFLNVFFACFFQFCACFCTFILVFLHLYFMLVFFSILKLCTTGWRPDRWSEFGRLYLQPITVHTKISRKQFSWKNFPAKKISKKIISRRLFSREIISQKKISQKKTLRKKSWKISNLEKTMGPKCPTVCSRRLQLSAGARKKLLELRQFF